MKASGLKSQEKFGKSDPYVRLYVRVLFKKKTTTKDSNLNPEWNESFEFDVEDTETQTLVLQVCVSKPALSDNFSSRLFYVSAFSNKCKAHVYTPFCR